MIKILNVLKRFFKRFFNKNTGFTNSKTTLPKKTPTIIELEAFGCVPAPTTDCVALNKKIKTLS